MDNLIEIHVDWGDDFQQTLDVFMMTRDGEFHAHRVLLTELPETYGEVFTYRPAVGQMNRSSAQWLMDRLWAMNFRPSGDATPGQLKAMQAHLNDMQTMAYKMMDTLIKFVEKRI